MGVHVLGCKRRGLVAINHESAFDSISFFLHWLKVPWSSMIMFLSLRRCACFALNLTSSMFDRLVPLRTGWTHSTNWHRANPEWLNIFKHWKTTDPIRLVVNWIDNLMNNPETKMSAHDDWFVPARLYHPIFVWLHPNEPCFRSWKIGCVGKTVFHTIPNGLCPYEQPVRL